MKIFSRQQIICMLFCLGIAGNSIAQDTLLTAGEAIENAIQNNYGIIISRNTTEISKIQNNWANAGAIPVVSATANKIFGSNNLQQKLSNGTVINKNGATVQNLNAGLAVSWRIFDGFKMFATKRKLEELERNGEYAFRKNLNETIYNVIAAYYNVVSLSQQLRSTHEQIELYNDRLFLSQRRLDIGTGAKYEVLESQVDLNEQRSLLLSYQNSLAIAKNTLTNFMGFMPDTAFNVEDSIIIHPLPDISEAQSKIDRDNPDLLLAASDLVILFETKNEYKGQMFHVVSLNGFYNFARSSNSAGFNLFNQTYGPSGSVGVSIPLFTGGLARQQLAVSDIDIRNQQTTILSAKNDIQTALSKAYINYYNSVKIVELEKNNLELAQENIFIASERFRKLNITAVELRQIQISYNDAKTRLYNALYQAKLAEAQVHLLTGDIANL
ncbi:hypothetical protein BH20BAC1_BH20BAC1_27620 [soil metagenome]